MKSRANNLSTSRIALLLIAILFLLLTSVQSAYGSPNSLKGAMTTASETICALTTAVPQLECQALVDFYNTTNGINWSNNDNWLTVDNSIDICDWHGVTCDLTSITSLNLFSNNLIGTIPSSIGDLTNLVTLGLSFNSLSGSLQFSIGNLVNLQILSLTDNQFSGPLPSSIGNLTNLTLLEIAANQFSGPLPLSLTNLTSINGTFISYFLFSATNLCVPDNAAIQSWVSRASLGGYEGISCSSPCFLTTDVSRTECQALIDLYTSIDGANWSNNDNWLTVDSTIDICDWHGVQCDANSVTTLNLNGNNLTGQIPYSIRGLPNLENLSLQFNQLTGPIPNSITNLTNLVTLYLDSNSLTGQIPSSIGNLVNLESLSLANNQLVEALPPSIGDLVELEYLGLHHNQFSEALPSSLGNLTSLSTFLLSNNQFSGPLPSSLTNLNAITGTALSYFDFHNTNLCIPSNNSMQSWVPAVTGNNSSFSTETICSPCEFTVDVSLAECQSLIDLYTFTDGANWSNNDNWLLINDTIDVCDWYGIRCSVGSVDSLHLKNNNLDGQLPASIGNLSNLWLLELADNQLSGALPDSISNLSNLQVLMLYNNQLIGSIPASIGSLSNLGEVNISNNQFSGALPISLINTIDSPFGLLNYFYFYNTNLCIPDDSAILVWVARVTENNPALGTGVICGENNNDMHFVYLPILTH